VADDKTRILSAAEAARLFIRKPKVVGDKVVFYCDNGHRIVAPLRDGGKRGNCSKCGAPVTVPAAGAEEAAEGATMILSAPKESRVAVPGESLPPSSREASAEELPSFAPRAADAATTASVPGVPTGESPVAPALEAAAATSVEEDVEQDAGAAGPAAGDAGGWQFMQPSASAADGDEPGGQADGEEGWFGHPDAADGDAGDNPTARLVARLWVEHELGGTLELHLQDGSVILPQSYEPRWSRGTHGLFAAAAPDGSITLTAVAWESVQKIIVRNVKGLPDGMFE
jgi:hypothetical protein